MDFAHANVCGGAAEECFLEEIGHQVYAGDTALHLAAACYDADANGTPAQQADILRLLH